MKTIHLASIAFLGLLAMTGCAAPTDATSAEESKSSGEALTGPSISVTASNQYVSLTGSGFTAGGSVQLQTWNNGWQTFETVTASVGKTCFGGVCRRFPPGDGFISASFNEQCGPVPVTHYYAAVNVTTGARTAFVRIDISCIG